MSDFGKKWEPKRCFFIVVNNNISEKKSVPDMESFVEIFLKRELKRPKKKTHAKKII